MWVMPDQILSLILDWILSNYVFLKAVVSWALDTPFLGILWARGQGSTCSRPSATLSCSAGVLCLGISWTDVLRPMTQSGQG